MKLYMIIYGYVNCHHGVIDTDIKYVCGTLEKAKEKLMEYEKEIKDYYKNEYGGYEEWHNEKGTAFELTYEQDHITYYKIIESECEE